MKTRTQLIPFLVWTMAMTFSALSSAGDLPDLAALQKMNARLTPVDLSADVSKLPAGERQALLHILQAAKLMDVLFLRQGWAGNESLLLDLIQDRTPLGQERLRAFLLNKGPWSRLDQGRSYLPGIPEKPAQSNYYPAGATKAELEKWMKGLPAKEKEKAEGFFTTVRRSPAGELVLVGYNQEYQPELSLAASYLRLDTWESGIYPQTGIAYRATENFTGNVTATWKPAQSIALTFRGDTTWSKGDEHFLTRSPGEMLTLGGELLYEHGSLLLEADRLDLKIQTRTYNLSATVPLDPRIEPMKQDFDETSATASLLYRFPLADRFTTSIGIEEQVQLVKG